MAQTSAAPTPDFKRPLAIALATTACVTAISYLTPERYAATAVGLAFLIVTYALTLAGKDDDNERVRSFGLSLGGLLELSPIDPRRLLRDAARATGLALGVACVLFPPFWLGFVWWWDVSRPFDPASLFEILKAAPDELLVVALSEEAFFRGYLQSALDRAWRPRWRVLGANVGPALLVTSVLFAAGHFSTRPDPARLAVFFPSLVFGWLRAKSGGIGAPMVFHALCNLFAMYLARSYGLG